MIEDEMVRILLRGGCVAVTGAGISVPSGIPPFRGPGGLWERYDPEVYAHISSFLTMPERFWEMYHQRLSICATAKPNPAHTALAEMETAGIVKGVITQNIDGLHQAAGSRHVIELHGNLRNVVCLRCGSRYPTKERVRGEGVPRCDCAAPLKPDVVLFGEPLSHDAISRAIGEVESASLVLVVGTSCVVWPAAGLPMRAAELGVPVAEVNPCPSLSYARFKISQPAEDALPLLVEKVMDRRGQNLFTT
ncbi:MAG: NAD-dependent deacylase [Candidatus Thermoplasmatota archaeon]